MQPQEEETEIYDFVILIAVLQVLPPEALQIALASISSYLKPGGWLLNFDGYHVFPEHELLRVEITSKKIRSDFPSMNLYYPSYEKATEWCNAAGFNKIEFEPFFMPFELERQVGNPDATHTHTLQDGRRLSMLGIIEQPWAFLKAQK
jgi:SAM-dependent methyltransferase